MYRMTA
jgi:hypothetical protein